MELNGKVALVTGGGAGIGRAIALALAGAGADVAVLDIARPAAEAVAEEIRALGRRASVLVASVADPAQAQAAVDQTVAELGAIDVLVNNAGWARPTASALDIPEAQWDQLMAINLKGPFLMAKAALPHMVSRGQGGRIINIASLAGRSTSVLMGADYTASKAGLLGLTRHLAREFAAKGITVNAVCPGTTDTGFIQSSGPEVLAATAKAIPMGRLGRPDEIAAAVVFLASPGASYMTGASVDVNGGLLMM
ncbi:MAG TPA: SDR family NAD(P)-dependent oxidoreductase [Symbiobacteriaceae bacterium]|jgi:3-oxoacyl-[acyl-carrier protein] reductase